MISLRNNFRYVSSFATPWEILNFISLWLVYPFARIVFAYNKIKWKNGWRLYGIPIIQKHRLSTIKLGNYLNLRSTVRSNPLGPNHPVILCTWQAGAVLEIGDHFGMSGGSICASQQITIGDRVAVGANTIIIDTDFHPLNAELCRHKPEAAKAAPIVIEDDVFIGMNVLILKGVRIGRGSVIGAGSIVTKDVPSGAIVAGNPARVIGVVSEKGE